jgi:hypothetical protein
MSRTLLLASLALGGLLLSTTATVHASTITCESKNGSYQSCPVDASGGVRLSRQLSSQGCWQNDTWGFDRNRIWVDHGCRAEFEVGRHGSDASSKNNALAAAAIVGLAAAAVVASKQHDDHHKNDDNRNYDDRYRYDDNRYANSRYGYNGYGGDPRRVFTCESRDNRRQYCDIPTRGHVEVYRQRSSSPCTYGRSWGVDRNSVWVTDGCRAEFAVF